MPHPYIQADPNSTTLLAEITTLEVSGVAKELVDITLWADGLPDTMPGTPDEMVLPFFTEVARNLALMPGDHVVVTVRKATAEEVAALQMRIAADHAEEGELLARPAPQPPAPDPDGSRG